MKYLLIVLAVASFTLLGFGLYYNLQDNPLQHKMFGFGTLLLFCVTSPLFLFWRRKKTSMKNFVWKNPNEKIEDLRKKED